MDKEISSVVYDSRKLAPGCLFICIVGAKFDGHDFAAEAVKQGAAALVVSKQTDLRTAGDKGIYASFRWRTPGMPWPSSLPHGSGIPQRS